MRIGSRAMHDQRRESLGMTRWQYHWLGWAPLYKFEGFCIGVIVLILVVVGAVQGLTS